MIQFARHLSLLFALGFFITLTFAEKTNDLSARNPQIASPVYSSIDTQVKKTMLEIHSAVTGAFQQMKKDALQNLMASKTPQHFADGLDSLNRDILAEYLPWVESFLKKSGEATVKGMSDLEVRELTKRLQHQISEKYSSILMKKMENLSKNHLRKRVLTSLTGGLIGKEMGQTMGSAAVVSRSSAQDFVSLVSKPSFSSGYVSKTGADIKSMPLWKTKSAFVVDTGVLLPPKTSLTKASKKLDTIPESVASDLDSSVSIKSWLAEDNAKSISASTVKDESGLAKSNDMALLIQHEQDNFDALLKELSKLSKAEKEAKSLMEKKSLMDSKLTKAEETYKKFKNPLTLSLLDKAKSNRDALQQSIDSNEKLIHNLKLSVAQKENSMGTFHEQPKTLGM